MVEKDLARTTAMFQKTSDAGYQDTLSHAARLGNVELATVQLYYMSLSARQLPPLDVSERANEEIRTVEQ